MTGLAGAGPLALSLLAVALLDGTFSGFRSSVGRTGLIDHRAADRLGGRRGALLVSLLLTPAAALAVADVAARHNRLAAYVRAGEGMLAVYAPYGVLVLVALAGYLTLGWRQRYLASALLLGPLTLARPYVAIAGAMLGVALGHDPVVATCAALSVAAVLAVQPAADRIWYAPGA